MTTEQTNQKEFYIIKANGEKEIFAPSKLENSLKRSGADKKSIDKVLTKITNKLKDGMKTSDIYVDAFNILKSEDKTKASKFSLKKAVAGLGPQGFVFEDFIGAIFRKLGYKILLRQHIQGLCVSHEVDLIAQNEEKFIMSEIKFHNRQGIKSDLKVILYVKERFDDIAKGEFYRNIDKGLKIENWLITNTKFTSQTILYAECNPDINLMSWNYPSNFNLYQLIEKSGLYPITVLVTLSGNDKKRFLESGILFCKDLLKGGLLIFDHNNISKEKAEGVLREINKLLKDNKK